MTKIIFNNNNYSVDDSFLSTHYNDLKQHLSTVMNGTGAVINLGGTAYNVDSAKLATAKDAFVQHLGTIAGNGRKVVIGGVEYGIDSAKVAGAVSDIEAVLGGAISGGGDSGADVAAGLYETGSNYTVLLKDWDALIAEGTICVDNGVVSSNSTHGGFDPSTLAGDLILPNDGSITGLKDFAFQNASELTEIVIPNSVTVISNSAFSKTGLTKIVIPDSVTVINSYAFGICRSLTEIIIPNSVTTIGRGAFSNCTSLTEIVIPKSVTSIHAQAFYNNEKLSSVHFGGTVEEWKATGIGDYWNMGLPVTHVQCSDGTVEL